MLRTQLRQFVLIAAVLLSPVIAVAQTTGGIAGTVKDTSGAVLPGVTVEAASPALIEKVRTVVTDGQGNYKITDLRPGTYAVTFTLTGFASVKREGVELTAGFTATINADLKVGSLQETVTVTGATPIVDVQNVRSQQVIKSDVLENLPAGNKSVMNYIALTLGATNSSAGRNDVGGDKGEESTGVALHGSRGDDGRTNWDGMNTNVFFGGAGGQERTYLFNTVAVQEVVVDTGGSSAETETGGANVNMVPREGSNQLKLFGTANFTNHTFSASHVPDDLKARGITDQSSLKQIWDHGIGVGGPLKKDRAWFFATTRWWGAESYGASNYYNKSTDWRFYVPDLSQPAFSDLYYVDSSFRTTVQATSKQKINYEVHLEHACNCFESTAAGANSSPEATNSFVYGPQVLNQITWSYTATNKLLIQAGGSFLRQSVRFDGLVNNVNKFTGIGTSVYPDATHISIQDVLGVPGGAPAGYRYNALAAGSAFYGKDDDSNNYNQKLTASYITGSHAIKTGLQTLQGHYDFYGMQNSTTFVNYTFRGGVPISLTEYAGPFISQTRLHSLGLFVQDQWTIRKFTLNYGMRYDHFNGHALAEDVPAGPFRPAFHVDDLPNLPNFNDITPRLGVAYDLFGNGKTAIKAAWGRYLMGQGGALAQQGFSPSTAFVQATSRSWTDTNGNYVPDCNLMNLAANGECGAVTNPLFGQPFSVQTLADDVRQGWFKREYNNEWNVQLQQELRPGIGVAVGYFHRQWGNMSVTQNTRVTAADFSSYCNTAPSDPRLGATSGQQICGYYDETPAGVAKGTALQITQASNFGSPSDVYNGVDIGFNARWGKGALAAGGVTIGREVFDICYANSRPDLAPQFLLGGVAAAAVSSSPQYPRNSQFCRIAPPWWNGAGSQAKLQVVYPLPYDFILSGVYKNLPGLPIQSNVVLTTPQISAILGRPSTSPGSQALSVIPYESLLAGTVFDQRLNQTDLRLTKAVRFGRGKVEGIFDIYNVFNSRAPQAVLTTYGATFERPTSILGGRLFKFGAQVDW
jgi:hypothetical protein